MLRCVLLTSTITLLASCYCYKDHYQIGTPSRLGSSTLGFTPLIYFLAGRNSLTPTALPITGTANSSPGSSSSGPTGSPTKSTVGSPSKSAAASTTQCIVRAIVTIFLAVLVPLIFIWWRLRWNGRWSLKKNLAHGSTVKPSSEKCMPDEEVRCVLPLSSLSLPTLPNCLNQHFRWDGRERRGRDHIALVGGLVPYLASDSIGSPEQSGRRRSAVVG